MGHALLALGTVGAALALVVSSAPAAVVDNFDGGQFGAAYAFTSHSYGSLVHAAAGAPGGSSEALNAASFDATASNNLLRLQAHDNPYADPQPPPWSVTEVRATAAGGPLSDTTVGALVGGAGGNGDNGVFARSGTAGRYELNVDFFEYSEGQVALVRRNASGTPTALATGKLPSFTTDADFFLELTVTGTSLTGVALEGVVYSDETRSHELLRLTETGLSGSAALDAGEAGVVAGLNDRAPAMYGGVGVPFQVLPTNPAGTFDHVSVVPEPAGLALLALGATGLLARRRPAAPTRRV